MAAAVGLMLLLMVLSHSLELKLAGRLGLGLVRAALQLAFLAAVLGPVFAHNVPWVVLPYIAMMTVFASREAAVNIQYMWPGKRRHIFAAFAAGLVSSALVSSALVLRPTPWWDAATMIPVIGMLLGGPVVSLSLGCNRFLSALLSDERALLETILAVRDRA
jgi:putative ABC transport system permease protein